MTLKIEDAIEEIERALAGNKPKYANDIYLNNAIRYLQEIKSPSLTDDQQVVLEKLKELAIDERTFYATYRIADVTGFYFGIALTKAEQFQVLAAFANYGLEDNQ